MKEIYIKMGTDLKCSDSKKTKQNYQKRLEFKFLINSGLGHSNTPPPPKWLVFIVTDFCVYTINY